MDENSTTTRMIGRRRTLPRVADRRFGIGDAMILVAATAVGLFAVRFIAPDLTLRVIRDVFLVRPPRGWTALILLKVSTYLYAILMTPLLSVWTAAALLMRMRWPRPTRRHLACRPGAMACLVAMVAVGLVTFGEAARLGSGLKGSRQAIHSAATLATTLAGAAVLGSWIVLALGGRWGAKPSGIDRLGRLIGAAWVAAAILCGCEQVFL